MAGAGPSKSDKQLLTRAELAQHFKVSGLTILRWTDEGMPVAEVGHNDAPHLGRRPPVNVTRPSADRDLTRQDVAAVLQCHPDSVTRKLGNGLASAVVRWGGRSKTMIFSELFVLRFHRAMSCGCDQCRLVVEDMQDFGAHLTEARHGVFQVCGYDCLHTGGFCQPCARMSRGRVPEQPEPIQ